MFWDQSDDGIRFYLQEVCCAVSFHGAPAFGQEFPLDISVGFSFSHLQLLPAIRLEVPTDRRIVGLWNIREGLISVRRI